MIKRQRKAILLVALACLVVLICSARRMSGLHALVINATAVTQSAQQQQDTAEAPVTPCELLVISRGEVKSVTTGWTSGWGMRLRLWLWLAS